MAHETLELSQQGPVAVLKLNRPEVRNALSAHATAELGEAVLAADADEAVAAMVLTGADPAFCAGFDLKNLGPELRGTRVLGGGDGGETRGLLPAHAKPIIGAINGPAVTGGLELALGCDFLIASERASFADTHARVGILPAGGMTIRLPELVGVDRARRMSLTGEFVGAEQALTWGLVTEVVPHEQLLDRAVAVVAAIAELDGGTVAELRALYGELAGRVDAAAWTTEQRRSLAWMKARFDDAAFAKQADAIIARGSQLS